MVVKSMKYKGYDYQMCDAWFLNDNDRIHIFNLKLPGSTENLSVAHSYTDDLVHFNKCSDILNPLYNDDLPDDYLDKWTGCGYTSPEGLHYIYYTMRNKYESQKIGVAMTRDFENYELYSKNPILVPDKNIFCYSGNNGIKEDCRDMIIVYNNSDKKYYGYFAAMAETNGRLTGVIGVAESYDLLSWTNQSIAYVPRFDGVIEVPDVYFLNGKWYLTFLTHSSFGAKGSFSDSNVQSGTIYASAETPRGPFIEGSDNVFIGGTTKSGFTCRTFIFKGKRYVMYIDKSKNGWALSLPKEVKVVDGNLRPCYTEILKNIRQDTIFNRLTKEKLEKLSSSVAWNVGDAKTEDCEDGILISTNEYSYQCYLLKNVEATSAEIEFNTILNCIESGIVIRSNNSEYLIAANTKEQTLILYEDLYNYNIICKRNFDFIKGKEYDFRIILLEGQIEIYVDDVLIMQNEFNTCANMNFGFCIGCGESIYKSFRIYLLEE